MATGRTGAEPDWTRPGAYPVADGVYRIPLPLPQDGLRAVNVYALTDPDGIVLIDSGWALPESLDTLHRALAGLGSGLGDVRRVLVTHVHRDHYTQAVTLRRQFGSRIGLGAGERPSLELAIGPQHRAMKAQLAGLRRCGAATLADELYQEVLRRPRQTEWELPDEWLTEGRIALAERVLDAVPTPGHTQGHLVFTDRPAGLLFAGDHVLPHITPSLAFEPAPGALPLRDYLGSLRRVREMPDLRLLPAHGPVTDSAHRRIDELLAHHDTRLDAAEAAVRHGAGIAVEVAKVLTWTRRERHLDELDPYNQMLAVLETAAHLDLLVAQGRLRAGTVDDVTHYAA